jgi:hypothetical protein
MKPKIELKLNQAINSEKIQSSKKLFKKGMTEQKVSIADKPGNKGEKSRNTGEKSAGTQGPSGGTGENSDFPSKTNDEAEQPTKASLHEHMLMMELRLAAQQMKRSCRKTETEIHEICDHIQSLEVQLEKLNTSIGKIHDLILCEQNLIINGYYSLKYKNTLH